MHCFSVSVFATILKAASQQIWKEIDPLAQPPVNNKDVLLTAALPRSLLVGLNASLKTQSERQHGPVARIVDMLKGLIPKLCWVA